MDSRIAQAYAELQRGGYAPELATAAGSDGIRNASAGELMARGIPAESVTAAVIIARGIVRGTVRVAPGGTLAGFIARHSVPVYGTGRVRA